MRTSGSEILQQLLLLLDQIVGDARVQPAAARRGVELQWRADPSPLRAARRSAFFTSVPTTRLVVLLSRNSRSASAPSRIGPVLDQRLERVALRDRDVVAADAIAVAELVDADQIGDGGLEGGGVAVKSRVPVPPLPSMPAP